ncbi:hypothetical protein PH586_21555 [Pseudomonas sp. SA3-5]|uniref:Uncharacterized protein n=1 Tax=Pseudomonas aestuarii TaxID=3018340 RepID=A0ABT4XL66_9PSED|nr:hypothetical protein [Pseudomonas aestuarii]MDA7088971.1 hypothetical protein [Pseudomonas aestuarii]
MGTTIDKSRLKWINSHDRVQMQWAWQYLSTKDVDTQQHDGAALVPLMASWPDDAKHRELLHLMSAAWRQKKCRSQSPGKKAYNFLLPTSAQANLKHLARIRRTTITTALEQLITDALEAEKRHNQILKDRQDEQKGKLAEMKAKLDATRERAKEQTNEQANKISELGKVAKQLAAEVSTQLKNLYEAQLQANSTLNEEDKAAVDELVQEAQEEIKERLALPKWLDAFNSRPYFYKPSKANSGT